MRAARALRLPGGRRACFLALDMSPDVLPPAGSPANGPLNTTVTDEPTGDQVTLYLANGGNITGTLVRETEQGLTLHWAFGDANFQRSEIQSWVKHPRSAVPADGQATESQPTSHDR